MADDELLSVVESEEDVQSDLALSSMVNSLTSPVSAIQPHIIPNVPSHVLRGGMNIYCQSGNQIVQGKIVPLRTNGTIGFFGRTKKGYKNGEGLHVLVSNHHVLKGYTSDLSHGEDSVTQPGNGVVAYSRADGVLSAKVDGGVAELEPKVNWYPGVKISPTDIVLIEDVYPVTHQDLPYPIWTWGSTTNKKQVGNITSIHEIRNSSAVGPQGQVIRPPPLIVVRLEGNVVPFCQEGDSGAPIMNNDNQIVGILWGGVHLNNQPTVWGFATLIEDVESQLNVTPYTVKNMGSFGMNPLQMQTTPDKECCPSKTNVQGPPLPKSKKV